MANPPGFALPLLAPSLQAAVPPVLGTLQTVPVFSVDSSQNPTGFYGPKGGILTGFSMLRDKVRKALFTQQWKPHSQMYWNTTVTAWAGSTAYIAGQAVSNGGNIYTALNSATSGANGPSGTTPKTAAPFAYWADGHAGGAPTGTADGVLWSFLCTVASLQTYLDGQTTAISVAMSLTTSGSVVSSGTSASGFYQPVTGTTSYGIQNYIPDTNVNQTNQFLQYQAGSTSLAIASWTGDLIKAPGATSVVAEWGPSGTSPAALFATSMNYNPSGNTSSPFCWEFETDSLFAQFTCHIADLQSNGVRIFVDDEELQPGLFPSGISGSNVPAYILLSFTGASKKRNIKIIGPQFCQDIRLTAFAQLYKVNTNQLRIAAIGDSVSAGSANGPSRLYQAWTQYTALELGIRYGVVNLSTGGTGVELSGGYFNFNQRITNSLQSNQAPANALVLQPQYNAFDIFILQVSTNDGTSSATLPNSYLTLLRNMRTLQPNALIIVHGPWPGPSGAAAATYGNTCALSAFATWNDPNSLYIHTLSPDATEGNIINGTGYCYNGGVAASGSSSLYVGGNQSSEQYHPNDAGIELLGKFTARALLQFLQI